MIRQEYHFQHIGAVHTPVHPVFQGTGAQYQRTALIVGGRRRYQPFQIGAPVEPHT